MISDKEYLDAKAIVAAYEKQKELEDIKHRARVDATFQNKKEWCEKNGGHYYLPDGKYSSSNAKTCQDCGHQTVKPFKVESESVQIDSHGTRETQYFVEIETNRNSSFYNKWSTSDKTSKEKAEALSEEIKLKRNFINTQIFY